MRSNRSGHSSVDLAVDEICGDEWHEGVRCSKSNSEVPVVNSASLPSGVMPLPSDRRRPPTLASAANESDACIVVVASCEAAGEVAAAWEE